MIRKIKVLRSHNDTKYRNGPFFDFYKKEGITRHFTVRDTPQQNGVAERMNRTLLEKVQCMLSNVGLDKQFWAEAVTYASHLINHLPSAALKGKTPLEYSLANLQMIMILYMFLVQLLIIMERNLSWTLVRKRHCLWELHQV